MIHNQVKKMFIEVGVQFVLSIEIVFGWIIYK